MPAQAENLVAVWVYADQDMPVAGATVEVVVQGRSVPQIDGRFSEATNEEGVVGLEFDSLPAAFTVQASGGQADGRPIRGALRTRVEGYQAGTIVDVNPVTTLADELRDRTPRLSERAATRRAKRILRIPSWHDITGDLQRSDDWFGGDAFLTFARPRGGVGRAIDRLATGRNGPGPFRDLDDEAVVTRIEVPEFVKNAALGLLEQLAGTAKDQILAKMLGIVGLPADLLDSDEIKEIRTRFDAIDRQLIDIKQSLSQLEQSIERTNYNTLVQFAETDVAAVDTAYRQLAWLARMSATDPTRKNYGAQLNDFIRTNLTPVPDRLARRLGGSTALGDNVLTAASRLVKSRARFFGPAESAQLQGIYAYYADAQSRAGLALLAFYEANPETYSQATIQNEMGRITTAVANQARDHLSGPGRWSRASTGRASDRSTGRDRSPTSASRRSGRSAS